MERHIDPTRFGTKPYLRPRKVKQAALHKVPGATVLRVETDSAGSPYEAHLQKSDGSYVTVKVDKQFQATDVENGFGGGPGGTMP